MTQLTKKQREANILEGIRKLVDRAKKMEYALDDLNDILQGVHDDTKTMKDIIEDGGYEGGARSSAKQNHLYDINSILSQLEEAQKNVKDCMVEMQEDVEEEIEKVKERYIVHLRLENPLSLKIQDYYLVPVGGNLTISMNIVDAYVFTSEEKAQGEGENFMADSPRLVGKPRCINLGDLEELAKAKEVEEK